MKRLALFCAVSIWLGAAPPANAGVKEELIRLQTDVLALQNQIRLLEKTFAERTDGLHNLVVQLNDQVGKTNQLLDRIATNLDTQASGGSSAQEALLQEVRNLTSRIDETGTRISALAQQVEDMKLQSKPITQRVYRTAGDDPQALALSADVIFNEAFNDLVQGNFDMAIEGFNAFLKNFPSNEKADDAQYNIGEAYYNQLKYPEAVTAFSRVIDDYASGDKIASAYFKRGKAELALQEQENAIADFKAVFEKYSDAPEANLAQAELEALGVDISKLRRTTRRRP